MPEIAEVAVYAKDLNKLIGNKKLNKVSFHGEDRWRGKIVPKTVRARLQSFVKEQCFFDTRGKSLYFQTKESKEFILFKLGMTGMFQLALPKADSRERHNFLTLEFDDLVVYYLDYRRFGRVSVVKEKEAMALAGFKDEFFFKSKKEVFNLLPDLKGYLVKPKISWLLDHGMRTGVGNYLANEALGRLNLNPFTPCKNQNEAACILKEIIAVAKLSFRKGGNSFKGGYFRLTGEKGTFYKFCQFYRNENVPYSIFKGRPVYSNFLKLG
jgi:formamidopyrimidine-DNA glycosylase